MCTSNSSTYTMSKGLISTANKIRSLSSQQPQPPIPSMHQNMIRDKSRRSAVDCSSSPKMPKWPFISHYGGTPLHTKITSCPYTLCVNQINSLSTSNPERGTLHSSKGTNKLAFSSIAMSPPQNITKFRFSIKTSNELDFSYSMKHIHSTWSPPFTLYIDNVAIAVGMIIMQYRNILPVTVIQPNDHAIQENHGIATQKWLSKQIATKQHQHPF